MGPFDSKEELSSCIDKTIIVWQLTRDESSFGFPKKILHGHNHFVSDIAISSDGQFALSSSWDKTLRLWDLNTGLTTRKFVGHTGDVLSYAIQRLSSHVLISASLSLPTTDRLFPLPETEPSSYGTLSESASSTLLTMVTLNGSLVSDSPPTPSSPSLFPLVGTRSSR